MYVIDADRLRAERQRAGMSREVLAVLAGVSRETVHRLETGSRVDPALSTVAGLARALNLTVPDLVREQDDAVVLGVVLARPATPS
jgi:transcriptional regulator with XRE-family HTH domain